MIDTNDLTEIFVQIRRADWANDREKCLEFIETFIARGDFLPTRNLQRASSVKNFSLAHFSPRTTMFKTVSIIEEKLNDTDEKEYSKRFHLIETSNLRAIIYRTEDVVFNLKGYLLDLQLEAKFYDHFHSVAIENNQNRSINPNDLKIENKTRQWVNDPTVMRIKTIIGGFGLFEMTGIWISNSPPGGIEIIKSEFLNNLKKLEPTNYE